MKIINFLFYLSFFLFTFGQLGRIAIPNQPVFGYLFEFCVFVLVGVMLFTYSLKPLKVSSNSIFIFLSWLLVTFLISVPFYNPNQNIVALLYLLRLVMYFVYFVYLRFHFNQHTISYMPIVVMCAAGILLPSAVQYFLYHDLGNLAYLGWDPHQYRLVGLFFDPPITVSILALSLLFFYYLYLKTKSFYFVLLAMITTIMIALTYSRGGYIAFAITLFFILFKKIKIKYIIGVVCILCILFLAIPKGRNESINLFRTTSIFTRFADYETGLKIYNDSPIFGIGYNHIRYEKDKYVEIPEDELFNPSHSAASLHSSYLMILATSGIMGVILLLLTLRELSVETQFAKYAVLFVGIISIFDNVMLHPFILFFLFSTICLSKVIHLSDTSL